MPTTVQEKCKQITGNQMNALITLYVLSGNSDNVTARDISVIIKSVPRNVAAHMKRLCTLGMIDIGWAVGCKGKLRAYKIKDAGIDVVESLNKCVIDETVGGITSQEQTHGGNCNG